MVKRLRRCPLTAKSAVRFRMGLPFPRQFVSGFVFFITIFLNVLRFDSFILFLHKFSLKNVDNLVKIKEKTKNY